MYLIKSILNLGVLFHPTSSAVKKVSCPKHDMYRRETAAAVYSSSPLTVLIRQK